MHTWLNCDFKQHKNSKSGKIVPILSFILIALGLAIFVCANMTYEAEDAALVSEAARKEDAAKAGIPPAGPEEFPPENAEPSIPAAPASAEAPASAASTEARAGVGMPAETPAPEAGAPADGDEFIPESEAASAAETAPVNASESAGGEPVSNIPPSGAVDVSETDDYFSDALFIGDSRTQGLLLYANLGNASYYAAKGLTVEHVFEKRVVEIDGGKRTVSDALERRAFGKVYLMFGLNELGWNSAEKFIETYGRVIDRVKETQPDAVIYVQAIMPVSARKSEKDPVHNNPNINRFNGMILNLAEEKGAIYLNVGESVSDGNGVLPEEASSDGIHLNRKYCVKWEEYLRSHEV
ncbi:MAG: GDSL-type esterase/lipase family protein [Clostridiales Family XIII bacterium]|jgi:lysophospholipase L1-like esterase|nr:GDSL-type esterase/lipase family protein [Clostridiales Family XIII bacterium]